jgi:hypothetical protein
MPLFWRPALDPDVPTFSSPADKADALFAADPQRHSWDRPSFGFLFPTLPLSPTLFFPPPPPASSLLNQHRSHGLYPAIVLSRFPLDSDLIGRRSLEIRHRLQWPPQLLQQVDG